MFYKLVLMEILYLGLTWPLLHLSRSRLLYFKDEHSELCESLKYSKMRVRNVKAAQANL